MRYQFHSYQIICPRISNLFYKYPIGSRLNLNFSLYKWGCISASYCIFQLYLSGFSTYHILLKRLLAVHVDNGKTPESIACVWEKVCCDFEQSDICKAFLIVCWAAQGQVTCKKYGQPPQLLTARHRLCYLWHACNIHWVLLIHCSQWIWWRTINDTGTSRENETQIKPHDYNFI